jgi:hypothetical protein
LLIQLPYDHDHDGSYIFVSPFCSIYK